MPHRILITEGLAESGLALLRQEAEVIQSAGLNGLGSVDALVVRGRTAVSSEVLAAASPRLRVVGRAGAGLDNIDLQAARQHGVIVVNAPGAGTAAVAELTLALMLALARQPASLRPLRLSVVPPHGTTFTMRDITEHPQFALSPDGSRIALVASAPGARPQVRKLFGAEVALAAQLAGDAVLSRKRELGRAALGGFADEPVDQAARPARGRPRSRRHP